MLEERVKGKKKRRGVGEMEQRLDAALAAAKASGKCDMRALKSTMKALAMSVMDAGEERAFSLKRTILWRLMLHVLPPNGVRNWQSELNKKREQYKGFLLEFKQQLPASGVGDAPSTSADASKHNGKIGRRSSAVQEVTMVTVQDPLSHPLCSSDSKSEWMEYFAVRSTHSFPLLSGIIEPCSSLSFSLSLSHFLFLSLSLFIMWTAANPVLPLRCRLMLDGFVGVS